MGTVSQPTPKLLAALDTMKQLLLTSVMPEYTALLLNWSLDLVCRLSLTVKPRNPGLGSGGLASAVDFYCSFPPIAALVEIVLACIAFASPSTAVSTTISQGPISLGAPTSPQCPQSQTSQSPADLTHTFGGGPLSQGSLLSEPLSQSHNIAILPSSSISTDSHSIRKLEMLLQNSVDFLADACEQHSSRAWLLAHVVVTAPDALPYLHRAAMYLLHRCFLGSLGPAPAWLEGVVDHIGSACPREFRLSLEQLLWAYCTARDVIPPCMLSKAEKVPPPALIREVVSYALFIVCRCPRATDPCVELFLCLCSEPSFLLAAVRAEERAASAPNNVGFQPPSCLHIPEGSSSFGSVIAGPLANAIVHMHSHVRPLLSIVVLLAQSPDLGPLHILGLHLLDHLLDILSPGNSIGGAVFANGNGTSGAPAPIAPAGILSSSSIFSPSTALLSTGAAHQFRVAVAKNVDVLLRKVISDGVAADHVLFPLIIAACAEDSDLIGAALATAADESSPSLLPTALSICVSFIEATEALQRPCVASLTDGLVRRERADILRSLLATSRSAILRTRAS